MGQYEFEYRTSGVEYLKRWYRLLLLVAFVLMIAACGKDESEDFGAKDAGEGAAEDAEADENDAGDAEAEEEDAGGTRRTVENVSDQPSKCPSGKQCTAPAGVFICTLPDSGYPLTCGNQQSCDFGECEQVSGQDYCVQKCGAATVESCVSGSQCLNPTGTYLNAQGDFFCTLIDTNLPPTCASQQDCPYGECLPYVGTKRCMQPCKKPKFGSCPSGTECLIVGFDSVCAKADTGTLPLCSSRADCSFGDCVKIQGKGYCVQYCDKPVYWITGSVRSLSTQNGIALVPIAGVQVCVYDDPQAPCATTAADGSYALRDLPEGSYYLLSMKKSGYLSSLTLSYPFEQQTTTVLFSDEQMRSAAVLAGGTYPDAANGFITFYGVTTAYGTLYMVDGLTAKIQPQGGIGPVYLNQQGLVDRTLTSASTAGWGAFFNVPPGTYTISFSHPLLDCDDPEVLMVAAGYMSASILAYCQ